MRRLCEDARFLGYATVPQLCMWLHSRWRFGESWQMDGSTTSSPPVLMILCPLILSAQARWLSKIFHHTRYLAE